MILALAGGVGGAKLAAGLAGLLPPEALTVVVNTGDDFEHLGLAVSPDLDTVMYTLAGIANAETGWGVAGETWNFMAALERLGGETWFRLGDHDLATHVERTRRLATESLSAITADFCARLGVRHRVVPMSDAPVRTVVHTSAGLLAFQDYFVRRRAEPVALAVSFEHDGAAASAGFLDALRDPALAAIVFCPSNPYLSIFPILSLPGIREALRGRRVPCVAVSPIISGEAVKGPAAKLMRELGAPVSPAGIAALYDGLLDGLVVDERDAALAPEIGIAVRVAPTLMRAPADRLRLAETVLEFAAELASFAGARR